MKKSNFGKKAVVFTTAAAMLATSGMNSSVTLSAKQEKTIQVKLEKQDNTYGKTAYDRVREKIASKEQTLYRDDQMVDIIVELKEASLLDQYARSSGISSNQQTFQQYLKTSVAKSYYSKMQSKQNSALSNIEKVVDNAKDVELRYQYSTVMNGFAIRARYGELDAIRKLSNVKSAFVAPTFERPEPVLETNMTSSKELIGTQGVWDTDYKGEGQVVAILDTGLDTHHEAFQTAPKDAKYNKDMVQKVITEKMLNANITKADPVYVNEKVPYVYDYADKDTVVDPTDFSLTNGNSHGTHVAGTVAGKSNVIEGVAPEAQLMIFKVFPDATSGARTSDIVAALEDCVRLGVDVVNMSLGSSNGFTDGSEEELVLGKVYERIMDAGISMSVSAGNSSTISENNARSATALASNPDTAVVGSPSTYSSSTSVASVVNSVLHAQYIGFGEEKLAFSESASGAQPKLSNLKGQSLDCVVVPNNGEEEDYEGLDLAGKVALVTRGGITFTDKVKYAAMHNAKAIIVCNNQPGTLSMAINDNDYLIPAVIVSKDDGEKLKNAEVKKVDISDQFAEFDTNETGLMSDFSSWGVSPNLDLKPEIAAPGGHIYSAVPFNTYNDMSGTSMAAPHVAGTYALVKQYIKKQPQFSSLSNEEIGKLATQLLMCTSHPTKNKDNVFYAPRQQGSGIVNIYDAIRTKAYLYTDTEVEVNNKPKLNLYDDPSKTGTFTKSFHINNISDKQVTYNLVNASVAETVEEDNSGELILGEKSQDVTGEVDYEISAKNAVCEGKKVTVDAGQDAVVTVTWTMNSGLKQFYDEKLVNGGFFEGFLKLENEEKEDPNLSIPYLGFYGDWTQAPLFDAGSVYDYNVYQQAPHAALSSQLYLGVNMFDELTAELIYSELSPYLYGKYYEMALKPDVNKIAISPNGTADSLQYLQLGMLRNARELTYTVTDKDGKVVQSGKSEFVGKSSNYSGSIYSEKLPINFDGKDEDGKELPNNSTYTVTVKGKLDYKKHDTTHNLNDTFSIPVTIDSEAPVAENAKIVKEEDKVYLEFDAKDNQYLSYVEVGVSANGENTKVDGIVLNAEEKNAEEKVKVDITNEYAAGSQLYVDVYDYAFNETQFKVLAVDETLANPSTKPSTQPVETSEQPASPSPTPTEMVKLGKVTGLVANSIMKDSITLKWNNMSDVTGYDIFAYNFDAKAFVKVGTSKTNTFEVNAIAGKKLTAGTECKFKVCAYKTVKGKKQTGVDSEVLTTATRPDATKLSAKAGVKKAVLSWSKVSNADGYEVYASTSKDSGYKLVKTVSSNATLQCTVTGLISKQKYYFKVMTYKNASGKTIHSAYSNKKSVKVK